MTENATYKTIHLPMVAVYMATLGVLMVYYSTVTSLFIKNRTIQSMRRRSMLLTLLSVVFSEIITIFYLVAAPFRLFLSCSVSMWTAYLLMPASVLLLGSRMLNLAVMRRSHEAAVLRVEESVAAQEIDVQKQLAERQPGKLTNVEATSSNQMHPWATSNPGEDLENGKGHAWSTNNTNGQQQQQQRNTSGAYVSLSSPTATGGFPKSKQTFALNRWFLRHLNLFSVKALLIYFGIYLSVALIYAAIIQFVGIGNNTIGLSLSEWPRNGCEMRGEFYPLYALFFILILLV
ncbi:hypothetical protein BDF22DRAFT_57967 [Syncephalis plumigaleata]|nr:hypothetical protein BDF22DRAFT_57967 [Syncephalis plumigaleata]